MTDSIKLTHGDGGKHTSILIREIFHKYFNNMELKKGLDAAVFSVNKGKMAFTTDSFVVKPLFFSGGDIGKLAVCGTVNDLAVSGATPLYLSAAFIIEEGFSIKKLEIIAESMAECCRLSGVDIITGDTKVVEKGSVDGIFINTCGVGKLVDNYSIKTIEQGDKIIITGGIGEHGTVIAMERYDIKLKGDLKSDCAPLNNILISLQDYYPYIKIMKDPTRGGVATALNELATISGLGICIIEENIPIIKEVTAVNEILGLDPLYMACEGRAIIVVKEEMAKEVLNTIRSYKGYENAEIIGGFIKDAFNIVCMETHLGGKRIINELEGEMLPRIC